MESSHEFVIISWRLERHHSSVMGMGQLFFREKRQNTSHIVYNRDETGLMQNGL